MERFVPDVPASTWRTLTATVAVAASSSPPTSEFDINKDGIHETSMPAEVSHPGAMSLRTMLWRGACGAWLETGVLLFWVEATGVLGLSENAAELGLSARIKRRPGFNEAAF